MSRLAKKPIVIPQGTEVTVADGRISVKGKLGELSKAYRDDVAIEVKEGEVHVTPGRQTGLTQALVGTYASHIINMIAGVNTPFEKKLILEGVGFKSEVKGQNLELALGFSHPVVVPIPEGLTVTAEKNEITVSGSNKEHVGEFAASVRALKKPEPYKGKGMRYADEVIRRKQGKKAV